MLLLCYPGCSTCKKAIGWLQSNKVSYTYRDIKQQNPSAEELAEWIARSGLAVKRLFNTSGTRYRELSLKERLPSMSTGEQIALLATDGMLVKRPLLIGDDFVLAGFRQEQWAQVLL